MTLLPPITGFTHRELEGEFKALGLEGYRARQVLQWVHRRRAESFDVMTDLSVEHRAMLSQRFRIGSTTVSRKHESADTTEKLLLRLDDGNLIETVLIVEGDRKTVCVSTQVGCPIRCVFCASGLNGLVRNLTTAEIVEQVLTVSRRLPAEERVDNLVIMGIGEPLLNYANLIRALKIFRAPWGMGIGYNRVTLSTVGILDKIPKLIEDQVTPNLAVSLHAPNDRIRAEVVPTMSKKLSEIIRAAVDYKRATNKTVTFEYVLIADVNDDKKHALELGKKLKGSRVKVNVIPFNRVPETPYHEPSPEAVNRFVKALGACGVPVTVRKRKGDAISAACGQLRHQTESDTAVAVQGEAISIPESALTPRPSQDPP